MALDYDYVESHLKALDGYVMDNGWTCDLAYAEGSIFWWHPTDEHPIIVYATPFWDGRESGIPIEIHYAGDIVDTDEIPFEDSGFLEVNINNYIAKICPYLDNLDSSKYYCDISESN